MPLREARRRPAPWWQPEPNWAGYTELSNQIRGLMKTFGLVVPVVERSTFKTNVRCRLHENPELATIIRHLLEAWCSVRLRAAKRTKRLISDARQSQACQLLMSIPGVGVVIASAFATAEDPANFRSSRSVGARLGLTTRRYQSGQVDYNGDISTRATTMSEAFSSKRPA